MMNEVTIIINGVRYDATNCQCDDSKVCKECDLKEFCVNIPYILTLCQVFDTREENRHFKKSDKKFEK